MIKNRFDFRIWDNNKKKYLIRSHGNFLMDGTIKGTKEKVEVTVSLADIVRSKNFGKTLFAEQCTGIEDIHGTKIYEGDIVKLKSPLTNKYNLYKCVLDKDNLKFVFECIDVPGLKTWELYPSLSDMISHSEFVKTVHDK